MKDDSYVAGQIERALHGDQRTHELGVRAEVDGDAVVLRGEVASEERRRLVADVAAEQLAAAEAARQLFIRNEVSVTEVLPPKEDTEVLPPKEPEAPEKAAP